MATVKKATNFPAQLATEMFSLVRGHSSLAKMCGAQPIPFNGKDVFTFNFSSDVSVVGESDPKPAGDAAIAPVQIRPVKVVYQSRVSDEFIYGAEEAKLQYLKAFAEGFAVKLAAGLDKMAIHGTNPAAGSASTVIGNNHIDYAVGHYNSGSNVIEYTSGTDAADAKIEKALSKIDAPNGIILNKTMRDDIAGQTTNNGRKYPEFAWGATPETLGGMTLDTNATAGADYAIVGDFNSFMWGYAKELPLEVIEYGNPDGGTYDLKRSNEVLLRSEAYIGWGILNAADFAIVVAPSN